MIMMLFSSPTTSMKSTCLIWKTFSILRELFAALGLPEPASSPSGILIVDSISTIRFFAMTKMEERFSRMTCLGF